MAHSAARLAYGRAVATNDTDALRAELAALTATHRALLARVDVLAPSVQPTMAGQHRCPACGAARIARVDSVLDRGDGNAHKDMGFVKPSFWSSQVVGKLACYACTACGLVEWHVHEPESLHDIEGKITIVDSAVHEPAR